MPTWVPVTGRSPVASALDLAARHRYILPNGKVSASVTGILSLLDHDSKASKMAGAAARITRDGGNYRSEWKAKADRGTRVHSLAEKWLQGEEVEGLAEDVNYFDGLPQFFADVNATPLEIERVVLCELGYGGRFDFIAEFDGQTTLVDIKTRRPYGLEHCCQLAAYRYADGMAVYDELGNLAAIESLPQIDRAGCLYLNPEYDNGYLFIDLSSRRACLRHLSPPAPHPSRHCNLQGGTTQHDRTH